MINIYRSVRYSDSDTFIFQGDAEDIQAIKTLVNSPFRVYPTQKGFETGNFMYLRFDYRERFFEAIKSYLRENYTPPEIRLSAFKADKKLSPIWTTEIWKQKVSDAIKGRFQSRGYSVRDNIYSGMVEVLPEQPKLTVGEVDVFQGFQFSVSMGEDFTPTLWASENFWLYSNSQPVNFTKISQLYGDASNIVQEIRQFTAQSSEEQFEFLTKTIKWIQNLAACEDIRFVDKPLAAAEMGLTTWFWLHDSDTTFEGASGFQTTLAQSLFEKGDGFLNQPDDIVMIFLLPEPNTSPIIPLVNWDQVVATAKSFASAALSKVELPFQVVKYPVSGDLNGCVNAVKAYVQSHEGKRVLCFMAALGSNAKNSTNEEVISADRQTAYLSRSLRDLFRGGYTETLDWNNLIDPKISKFIIDNAVMAGLYRLTAQPWRLNDLPFDFTTPENTYFLGLAGNIERESIATVLVDYSGMLVAYGGDCPSDGQQAQGYANKLERLIRGIFKDGVHHSHPKPKNIIVHLSPELVNQAHIIEQTLNSLGLECDILSIHPDSSVRFLQTNNKQGTPSNGVAVGNEADGSAYLMNTLSVGEKTNRGYIYPSPSPVRIQKIAGNSTLKNLAAQIYWLSAAHINSLHRTVDIPITISYSQTLLTHILKSRRPMRVTRNFKKTLYWL